MIARIPRRTLVKGLGVSGLALSELALSGLAVSGAMRFLMPASARASEVEPDLALNLDDDGVAVNGYDPVAYYREGEPQKGDPGITAEHDGALYRFVSTENRQMFLADPEAYAPAYGGYCAYGVRTGRKFETDPESWRIVDGKLYLLLNFGTKAIWDIDRSSNIQIADQIWPEILPYTDAELAKKAP